MFLYYFRGYLIYYVCRILGLEFYVLYSTMLHRRSSDSTVSEDAALLGLNPCTDAGLLLLRHWQSDALTIAISHPLS
jgi:hypothetical protein